MFILCGMCVCLFGKKERGEGGEHLLLYCYNSLLPMQMAVIPRNTQGHGWLRPAIGVVELSQCIIQVRLALRTLSFFSMTHYKGF